MLTSPLSVELNRLGVETKVFGVGGAIGPLTDSTVRNYAGDQARIAGTFTRDTT
ncbi:hypothetical protein [Serratia quinivorans]|uniref:hypothetical protein n=1 Tax=Serratia quinivorans TaxID=137545 RepID=UPI0021BA78BF|nr:hypothetical protein [Serratia quinivorans]